MAILTDDSPQAPPPMERSSNNGCHDDLYEAASSSSSRRGRSFNPLFLSKRKFDNYILNLFNAGLEYILLLFTYFFNSTFACFIPTTHELNRPLSRIFSVFVTCPIFAVPCLLSFLPALLAFPLWAILQRFRNKFVYRRRLQKGKSAQKWDQSASLTVTANDAGSTFDFVPQLQAEYTAVTANVCCLPEAFARINNLSNNRERAHKIASQLIRPFGQLNQRPVFSRASYQHRRPSSDIYHQVSTSFLPTDFLCIQETFDSSSAEVIVDKLSLAYSDIIYHVCTPSFSSNHFGLNSGLMFASRHQILAADFVSFTDSCAFCRLSGKGILIAQVLLGYRLPGQRLTGYISNTHLQAYEGHKDIVYQQLNQIKEFCADFRRRTTCHGDIVVLDILAGDFNCDNLSPCDSLNATSPLWHYYTDAAMIAPGVDEPWTIGTELRHFSLWDEDIQTADGLRAALLDPVLRAWHVFDGNVDSMEPAVAWQVPQRDSRGNVILTPVSGRRRIDRIAYKSTDQIEPSEYQTVTALAGLTDHLPISMTFRLRSQTR